jgi:hypothetical protein
MDRVMVVSQRRFPLRDPPLRDPPLRLEPLRLDRGAERPPLRTLERFEEERGDDLTADRLRVELRGEDRTELRLRVEVRVRGDDFTEVRLRDVGLRYVPPLRDPVRVPRRMLCGCRLRLPPRVTVPPRLPVRDADRFWYAVRLRS